MGRRLPDPGPHCGLPGERHLNTAKITRASSPQPGFPDVETLLLDVLAVLAPTFTVTPSDLQARLPVVRVRRLGGSDNRVSDTARVDVDVYASTREAAWGLAEQVRQRLLAGPHVTTGGVIDRVATEVAPHTVQHPDPATRQVTATYRVTTRR